MHNFNYLIQTFENIGAQFITSPDQISQKLKKVKALIFDWDGVFHSGYKGENNSSQFSETDSMGINMLRFGIYLQNGQMPTCSIITGENNTTAIHWGKREHLDSIFLKVKNKVELLPFFKEQYGIQASEILFVFDDILDLSLAKECGLRFMIRKKSNPLLINFCIQEGLVDYVSGAEGDQHALREVSEITLGLMGKFNETVNERMKFDDKYRPYIESRQMIKTTCFSMHTGKLQEV